MDSFSHLSPNKILNKAFECSCGRTHTIPIRTIAYQEDSLSKLPFLLESYKETEILLVDDENTAGIAGETIWKKLVAEGFTVNNCRFRREHELIPDEKAIGEILTSMTRKTAFILAVGSGVINDSCRFISSRTKIPYGIVATAPSMDGYASSISPLTVKKRKTSIPAGYPEFILSEPEILMSAPKIMIQAGFGDVLGKLTALADWNLSAILNGEHLCAECMMLVERAVKAVIQSCAGLLKGQKSSAVKLMDALVLSGLAMGLYGNSRPASGAEHLLAHFWESDAIEKGQVHALHGNLVGVASLVSALIYEKAAEFLPGGLSLPDSEEIYNLLIGMDMPINPGDLGITAETFSESMKKALYRRDRYTIFTFLKEHNLLDETADYLTLCFFGKKAGSPITDLPCIP